MVDEKKLKKAQTVYETLCAMLDEKKFHYDKHPQDLVITFVMHGDDIPMQFIVKVDAQRDLVRVVSPIPGVEFPTDKRLIGAIATSTANYKLADGSFDYDYDTGKVAFRLTSSYLDSIISKQLLEYMIGVSGYTIDEFNDKFLLLATGGMTIDDFVKKYK
ncbi:MAG: hypothetical protein J1F39_02865 [Clostridiales bacterium]|nr:hypothetical protein [Clostridiales bacterium]